MRNTFKWFNGILSLGGLIALILLLSISLGNSQSNQPTRQENPMVVAQATETPAQDSPLPTPIIEGTIAPTWTPFPTFTPWPTPTRQPGPTATVLPTPTVASNASGIIRYAVRINDSKEKRGHFFLRVDVNSNIETGPEPITLPEDLGFTPNRIFISPNQQYIVYLQAVEPGGRPYVYNTITGRISILFENFSGGSFYGWHPDGRHFLFWIDEVGMWLIDAETLDMTTLTYPSGPVQGASISPDGLTVAFIANDPPAIGKLWFVSVAGSDAKPQFSAGDISYLYSLAWRPDSGKLLYYGVCRKTTGAKGEIPVQGLCIFDLTTQQQDTLDLPFSGFAPVWSPDGRYIVATGVTPGEHACVAGTDKLDAEQCLYQGRSIYLVDTQIKQVSVLTSGIAPFWSPDGAIIAFLSNRTGTSEIWFWHREDQKEQQVTSSDNIIVPNSLSWAPEVK